LHCNMLYKLVAKVLANRLKKVLHKCISDSQSAFVPCRSIHDNAMVACEVVHYMKTDRRQTNKNVALKLDISKAYDRINWLYLKEVMLRLGFAPQWVRWILMCIETVDYLVLVNNNLVGPIIPGRGLRQGNPLSSYLFILCAEGLTALTRQAERRGDLHGVRICTNAPVVSHLLFTDVCFLFFRAAESEAHTIKNIFSIYEAASGQAINLPKSEIYYSTPVDTTVRTSLTQILGVQAVLGTAKYLGLPSMVGRSKQATFGYIKDRIWQQINSWSSKCLSKAGREVMIKSVLQSIPTYMMSIFLLPKTLIADIGKMLNAFWWGHGGATNRGLHWMSWEKLTVHKNNGGMGFKDLIAFNAAMLGKQAWKFITDGNSLVSGLFKSRYFPQSDFFDARIGTNPSYAWRSILSAKELVIRGARWSIGTGSNIPLMNQPWLASGGCILVYNTGAAQFRSVHVSELIDPTSKSWRQPLLYHLFD
jgi:hypothetical protein